MIEQIKNLYIKYKEIINYLIFGVLTTIVNFVVYFIFARVIGLEEILSNTIAWILSVLFAYITNKIYVFDSKNTSVIQIIKEVTSFVGCRILSGVIDVVLFAFLVKTLNMNDLIVKFINQVIVTVMNYVFSKLIIFKKDDTNNV